RDYPRICQKLRIRIFVERLDGRGKLGDRQNGELGRYEVTKIAKEVVVSWIAQCEPARWRISAGRRTGARNRIAISNCLGSRSTTNRSRPVNSVCLYWIGAPFHQ